MKNIIIVRHAKSDWDSGAKTDFDRPLNQRGLKDAPKMSKKLSKKGIAPDIFISSPAKRAITTCEYFAKEFDYPFTDIHQEKLLYSGNTSDYLDIISKVDNKKNNVILFGHNPVISHFASVLLNGNIGDMPTCAIVSIQLNIDNWSEINDDKKHDLLFIDYPKNTEK